MPLRPSRGVVQSSDEPPQTPAPARLPVWVGFADLFALVLLALATGVAITGGARFSGISITSWQRLVYESLAVLAIRHMLVPRPAIYQYGRAAAARNRPALAAVLLPFVVYFAIVWHGYDGGPYLRGDCIYYYETAVSLVRDGDLDLSNQFPNRKLTQFSDQFAFTTDLRPVPKHPIPMAVASAPFIALFGEPGALTFNLVQLALLLAVLYWLAARVATEWAAAAAVVLTGIFSVLPHYVYNYSPDVFSALLLSAGLLPLPRHGERHPLTMSVVAGLLTGIAIVSKYALFLFAPGMLALIRKPRLRPICALAIGAGVPLAAFMALNAHLFGSPFTTPYDRLASITPGGHMYFYSPRGMFTLNPIVGAYGQLFDRVHGLLFSSPITIPSLAGLFLLARRDRALAWYLGGSSLALFLFYCSYNQWNASHYGDRFLIALIVLAAIPLAAMLDTVAEAFAKR